MPQEQMQLPEAESPSKITKGLETDFISLDLEPGKILSLTTDIKPMGGCFNQAEGVYQDLKLVIKAGDDFFSVVDVFVAEKPDDEQEASRMKATVITRHHEDDRAEIVGFIEPEQGPLVVGRTVDNKFADNVSRKHFAVGVSPKDGHIEIADMKSSNGTRIFATTEEVKRLHDSNPINDTDFWSVKSSDLKASLKDRLS